MPGILSFIQPSKKIQLLFVAVMLSAVAMAKDPSKAPDAMENPLAQFLIFIIVLLAVAIGILAHVVNGAASIYRDKLRAEKEKTRNNTPVVTLSLLTIFLLGSMKAMAQDTTAKFVQENINGLSYSAFYALIAVICLEILVMIVLIYQLKWLVGIRQKQKAVVVDTPGVPKLSWWDKLNRSVAIEREKEIDLSHDYDGIRELDNTIPPWWTVAFLFTILFGVGYLWRYHVVHSAPLQIEEFKVAMAKAEEEKAAYLAKAANLVDESNIQMLDNSGIVSGKALFTQNCAACHGSEGQGAAVGPNLSDKYWIHGGSIQDIFKTIKYGWPEAGMRSWQEDMSPVQLAQLTSYVKSLQGSNPADPKAPQGELFEEAGPTIAASDSAAIAN